MQGTALVEGLGGKAVDPPVLRDGPGVVLQEFHQYRHGDPLVGMVGPVVKHPPGPQAHGDLGQLPAIGRLSDVPHRQKRIAGRQSLQAEGQQLIGKGQFRRHDLEAQGHRQRLAHVEPQGVLPRIGGDNGPDRAAVPGSDPGVIVPGLHPVMDIARQPGQQRRPARPIQPSRRRQALPPLKLRQRRRPRPLPCQLVKLHPRTSDIMLVQDMRASGK